MAKFGENNPFKKTKWRKETEARLMLYNEAWGALKKYCKQGVKISLPLKSGNIEDLSAFTDERIDEMVSELLQPEDKCLLLT